MPFGSGKENKSVRLLKHSVGSDVSLPVRALRSWIPRWFRPIFQRWWLSSAFPVGRCGMRCFPVSRLLSSKDRFGRYLPLDSDPSALTPSSSDSGSGRVIIWWNAVLNRKMSLPLTFLVREFGANERKLGSICSGVHPRPSDRSGRRLCVRGQLHRNAQFRAGTANKNSLFEERSWVSLSSS